MLFYCDAGDIGKVGSMSTKGLHHRVLIKEFGMKPRSIVVDAAERFDFLIIVNMIIGDGV
jgi:hypothetical protein